MYARLFLQYAAGPLTVMAGKFVTLAGAEVINPTLNTNYSRSLLFFDSEPLTHTGIRASYAVTDTITVTGGVNNGWNASSNFSYGSKTGEISIGWAPANKIFALAATAYFGKNDPTQIGTAGFDADKTLIDIVATYNATSALTFIVNFDWESAEIRRQLAFCVMERRGPVRELCVQRPVARVGARRISRRQGRVRHRNAPDLEGRNR